MNRAQLADLIREGENSGVEFKRGDVRPEDLAKEMAALLNLEGGSVLLGVEDGGRISGLRRSRAAAEQWVMNVARQNLRPATIPVCQEARWSPPCRGCSCSAGTRTGGGPRRA